MLLLFFSIMIMNIFIFLPLETNTTDSIEIGEKNHNIKDNDDVDLKCSSVSMIVDPISINDPVTNTWAWAKTQPWCTGSGTSFDPYLIKNLIINGGGKEACIYIYDSNVDVIIDNCILYNAKRGIVLYDCGNIDIVNNKIYDITDNGIDIESCGYIDVLNNEIFDIADWGIRIWDGDLGSVIGNKIYNCEEGIRLIYSDWNQISDNVIFSNINGTVTWQSSDNTLSYNYIYNNIHGMDIQSCFYHTISHNIIRDNLFYGIIVDEMANVSYSNTFYYNYLKGNTQNALDLGGGGPVEIRRNYWDYVTTGNYWDDYAGVDTTPKDGIGDSNYDVPPVGDPFDVDYFPLYDKTAPTMNIINPLPGQVFYSSGPEYSISASDPWPGYIFHTWYTLDGGKTNYTDIILPHNFNDFVSFTGSINQEAWDAVSPGEVTIRFYVDDKPGHTVFQDVIIYKEALPPGLGDGTDDDENKYFTLVSPLGIMLLGGMAVPVGMILKHELKRIPKDKGRWITKAGNRIFIKGKKKLKKKK